MVTSRSPSHQGLFSGFLQPDRDQVPIPAGFLRELLPEITDINELRVVLTIFRLVAEDAGFESPLAEKRLLSDRVLRNAVRVDGIPSTGSRQAILHGLELLVTRGAILRVEARTDRSSDRWYFLHTPVTRELVRAIERGAIAPPRSMWIADEPPSITTDPPTAFLLYEQNVGPLTPMIADRITHALGEYPAGWIEDAIEEAVAYNRRNWKYIERILESWMAQGRSERS